MAELGEPGGHGLTQEGGPARASILGSYGDEVTLVNVVTEAPALQKWKVSLGNSQES